MYRGITTGRNSHVSSVGIGSPIYSVGNSSHYGKNCALH